MNLALFDLDHTLIPTDSDHEWGRFLIRRGVVDASEYQRKNDQFYADYKAGTLDIQAFLRFALAPLAAHSRDTLAQQMAAHCHQRGVAFLVAGDARLAQRLGAGFHCPSYLITRRPQFLASGFSTAAVHNLRQMVQAAQMGFGTVLLSPAFETVSHPDAPAWGAVRFSGLARAGQQMGLRVFALGGIDDARWRRLKEAHDTLSGFAAISYFRPANGL